MRTVLLFFLISFVFLSCQRSDKDAAASTANLGDLEHQFTISTAARTAFDEGLLLLHSFEYDDAREAFDRAIAADSSEVMAYWGAAMTHYKALWGLQDVDAGRAVMQLLGPTQGERLAEIDDPLEKDFWQALEILYGEGEFSDRNQAYADYMATLYDKHSGNQEVAAFYALGLMWSVPLGRDADVFDRSARVAAGILKENPRHPGALHYTIHAYDDPDYAELAHQAADEYARVAPDATHALHMPSHIYLALGLWDEVVASNEASYQASLNRLERKQLGDDARGYHSYAWLHYGYLQQGRHDDAHRLLKDMVVYAKRSPTKPARSYLISMQNAFLAETGGWSDDLEVLVVERADLGLSSKAGHHFFQASLAHLLGHADGIQEHIDSLGEEIAIAEAIVTDDGVAMCSAGPTRYAPNKNDLLRARVMMHQIQALKYQLAKQDKQVEEALQQAVALETEAEYSFGPPDIPLPSFEQYGDWLLKKDRMQEALAQFDKSLERAPRRRHALKGKLAVLEALGDSEGAKLVREELEAIEKPGAEKLTAR